MGWARTGAPSYEYKSLAARINAARVITVLLQATCEL